MQHNGRLVDLYHQCQVCNDSEQQQRQEFTKRFNDLLERRQANLTDAQNFADAAAEVLRLVRREKRRRRKVARTAETKVDILCEVLRKELNSCVYNDGGGETITKTKFRQWKEQWAARLNVSTVY